MLNDDLNKFLKEKLSQNPAWDKEDLWQEIEPRLSGPKKRRVGGLLLFAGLAAMIVGIIFMLLYTGQNRMAHDQRNNTKEIASSSEIASATEVKERTSHELEKHVSIITETKDESIPNKIELEESIPNAAETKANATPSPEVAISSISEVRPADSSAESVTYVSELEIGSEIEGAVTNMENESTIDGLNEPGISSVNMLSVPEAIPGVGLGLLDHQFEDYIANVHLSEVKSTNTISKVNVPRWHRFSFYGGIGTAVRHFDAQSDLEGTTEINSRKDRERVLESLELGIQGSMDIFKNIYISTGLNYNRQTELLETDFQEVRTENRQKANAYVYNHEDGTQQFISGTVEVEVYNDRNIVHYNSYSAVNVPLLVGLHQRKSNWSYWFEAGPALQLSQSFDGIIVNADNQVLENEAASELYHNDLQLNLQSAVGLSYLMGQHWSLDMGIQYRHQLHSTLLNTSAYDLRYSNFSTRLGVSYFFGS